MNTPFDPGRRTFLLSATAALGGVGLMGLIREALAMGVRPQIEGVQKVRGEVKINGVLASVGKPVLPGDIVTTGKDSHVVLIAGQDAFLVRDGSRVEITGRAAAGKPSLPKGLKIDTGKVLSVFAKGAIRVVTPTVVAGVRGTGMYVESEADLTYICACYGTVDIEASAYPGIHETVTTTHHEQPRYVLGKCAGSPILKAPVLNHTDAELIMLEALVDRVPPFSGWEKY